MHAERTFAAATPLRIKLLVRLMTDFRVIYRIHPAIFSIAIVAEITNRTLTFVERLYNRLICKILCNKARNRAAGHRCRSEVSFGGCLAARNILYRFFSKTWRLGEP